MESKGKYKTKHKEELREYLDGRGDEHFSAADVYDHFALMGRPMGRTTIYRQLEEMVSSGEVKKYIIDENSSACYEYLGGRCDHADCIHMKCEKCGRLIHLECRDVTALEKHVKEEHGFRIDRIRTVLYGICSECDV
jgi:Fur family ferric uptake transcriptional regulator